MVRITKSASPGIVIAAAVLAASAIALAGCGRSKPQRAAPPTYPVKGVVKFEGGKLPGGSVIEFRPERSDKPAELTAKGVIHSSGEFELCILYVDRILNGALEGPHTVSISLPTGGSAPISVSEKFTVEPHENRFTVNVPKQ